MERGRGLRAAPPRCLTRPYLPQVALQFPDELLADAAAVAARMEAATGAEMYILGDTTYGRSVRGRGECPGGPPRAGVGLLVSCLAGPRAGAARSGDSGAREEEELPGTEPV